jgi:hypothetical protein
MGTIRAERFFSLRRIDGQHDPFALVGRERRL